MLAGLKRRQPGGWRLRSLVCTHAFLVRPSRRIVTCNTQVRAASLPPQDELYRDVEYFLTYMSNGLPVSGPGARP